MAFKKVREVKKDSVNLSYISTDEYVAARTDIVTPEDGATIEKRRIMYADLNGVLFDFETGNQIVEVQNPHLTDIFKDRDIDYSLDATEVFAENALLFKYDCTKLYYGPATYSSVDYYIDDNGVYIPTKYRSALASAGEPIKLVYDNGEEYTGNYEILLKRAYSESVEVNTSSTEYSLSSHQGMTSYIVTVLLSNDVSNLFIKFPTGELEEDETTPGLFYPKNINPNYKEKVYPKDIFKYVPLESLYETDDDNACSSIKTEDGYKIQTKDRAIIDSRELDFFFWRISGELDTTSNMIAVGKEVVNIGVIGSTVDAGLANFFDGDNAYSLKYKFNNPYRKGAGSTRWNIRESLTQANLNKYDIVIFRDNVFNYRQWAAKLNNFINNGGTVLVDFNRVKPNITDSTIKNLKLNLSFNRPSGTAYKNVSQGPLGQMLISSPTNYKITPSELARLDGNTWTINANRTNSLLNNRRRLSIFNRVRTNSSKNGGLFISTFGITRPSTLTNQLSIGPAEQMLVNFLSENIKLDTEMADIRKIPHEWTIKTPWVYSFTAGNDVDGTPLLTPEELTRYGFYSTTNSEGKLIWKRSLSSQTARELLRAEIQKRGLSSSLSNVSIHNINIEIANANGDYVTLGLSGSGKPWAYSTRISDGTDLPDGYKWIEYPEKANSSIRIPSPESKSINLRVLGTFTVPDTYEFTWSADAIASKRITVTKIVRDSITNDCDWVDDIRIESDDKWQSVHGGEETSNANLKGWGITNAKWYPCDGRAWYIHNGSSGSSVKFYQRALNELKALGRHRPPGSSAGMRNMPLKVDGVFGTKTKQAISDYQSNWGATTDGVIDAGTAGHIMRNFGNAILAGKNVSAEFKEVWTKYGSPHNILDASGSTWYGKRSWFNTAVNKITDAVLIKLNRDVNIDSVYLQPYSINNRPIHLTKIDKYKGGSWEAWINRTDSNNIPLYNSNTYTYNLAKRASRVLRVSFFQDHNIGSDSNEAQMWAFKNIIFEGEITSTEIKYENVQSHFDYSEFSISYDNPTTFKFIPEEVKALGSNFAGYVTTAANLETYIKNSISPTRTNTYCGPVLNDVNGNYITLTDNAKSLVKATQVDETETVLDLTKFTVNGVDSTRIDVDASIAEGTIVEIEFYAIVDITVDCTLNNTTGEITVVFTMTEILEDSTDTAVYGPIWNATIRSNQKMVLDDGSHFPTTLLTAAPGAEMYDITLSVISSGGDSTIIGAFYDVSTGQIFSTLNAEEYTERRQNLRLAVLSTEILYDSRGFIGTTTYPKRYGCKPFCLAWEFGENSFGVKGLTNSTPDKPWNLRVNSGVVTRKINEPILEDMSQANKDIILTYKLEADTYSTTDDFPFVSVTSELVDIVDVNKITIDNFPVKINSTETLTDEPFEEIRTGVLAITNPKKRAPISSVTTLSYMLDDGVTVTEIELVKNGYGDTANWNVSGLTGEIYIINYPTLGVGESITSWQVDGEIVRQHPEITLKSYTGDVLEEELEVLWVDNRTGEVIFTETSYDYLNGTRIIRADYTYREEFVSYTGYNPDVNTFNVFDVCPYDGHYIYKDTDNTLAKTIDNIGNNIYIYALPNSVEGSETIVKTNGGLRHTFDSSIFDKTSPKYNPYALKVAVATMKQTITSGGLVRIDTRNGGGGFTERDHGIILAQNEDEAIWDIKQLDGETYFKGGSVIITLPLSWKVFWTERYQNYSNVSENDAKVMVEDKAMEIAKKYSAAGKHIYIEWDENL